MENLYLITNISYSTEKFKHTLKCTGIPYEKLSEMIEDNQIILNEHYFKNVIQKHFKKSSFQEITTILNEEKMIIEENQTFSIKILKHLT